MNLTHAIRQGPKEGIVRIACAVFVYLMKVEVDHFVGEGRQE